MSSSTSTAVTKASPLKPYLNEHSISQLPTSNPIALIKMFLPELVNDPPPTAKLGFAPVKDLTIDGLLALESQRMKLKDTRSHQIHTINDLIIKASHATVKLGTLNHECEDYKRRLTYRMMREQQKLIDKQKLIDQLKQQELEDRKAMEALDSQTPRPDLSLFSGTPQRLLDISTTSTQEDETCLPAGQTPAYVELLRSSAPHLSSVEAFIRNNPVQPPTGNYVPVSPSYTQHPQYPPQPQQGQHQQQQRQLSPNTAGNIIDNDPARVGEDVDELVAGTKNWELEDEPEAEEVSEDLMSYEEHDKVEGLIASKQQEQNLKSQYGMDAQSVANRKRDQELLKAEARKIDSNMKAHFKRRVIHG